MFEWDTSVCLFKVFYHGGPPKYFLPQNPAQFSCAKRHNLLCPFALVFFLPLLPYFYRWLRVLTVIFAGVPQPPLETPGEGAPLSPPPPWWTTLQPTSADTYQRSICQAPWTHGQCYYKLHPTHLHTAGTFSFTTSCYHGYGETLSK